MTITEIQVTAGRVFQDPNDPKTTLRTIVCLKASADPGQSDYNTRELQMRAERLVQDHRDRLVSSLENRRSIQHVQDVIGDVRDGADEQNEEAKALEMQLAQLQETPSIFNEKPDPERERELNYDRPRY